MGGTGGEVLYAYREMAPRQQLNLAFSFSIAKFLSCTARTKPLVGSRMSTSDWNIGSYGMVLYRSLAGTSPIMCLSPFTVDFVLFLSLTQKAIFAPCKLMPYSYVAPVYLVFLLVTRAGLRLRLFLLLSRMGLLFGAQIS